MTAISSHRQPLPTPRPSGWQAHPGFCDATQGRFFNFHSVPCTSKLRLALI